VRAAEQLGGAQILAPAKPGSSSPYPPRHFFLKWRIRASLINMLGTAITVMPPTKLHSENPSIVVTSLLRLGQDGPHALPGGGQTRSPGSGERFDQV
jgi:hypothetical protein